MKTEEEHHRSENHSEHHQRSRSSPKFSSYAPHIAILAVVVAFVNLALAGQSSSVLKIQQTQAIEEATLPTITITSIVDSTCTQCTSVQSLVDTLQAMALNVTSTKSIEKEDATTLITQYSLTRIPAIILRGDIDSLSIEGFTPIGDGLVYSTPIPPYVDTTTNSVMGVVTATILSADCEECFPMDTFLSQLRRLGVHIDKTHTIDWEDSELVATYRVRTVPTVVLSKDFSAYTDVVERWTQVGTKESDGSYVLRPVDPPYIDVSTKNIVGIVDVTYLLDGSCTQCVTADDLETIFTNVGVVFGNSQSIDVNSEEGQSLLRKYSISVIPTLIFSDDAGKYPAITGSWSQVGAVVEGRYVLHDSTFAGTVKNLTSGELIVPPVQ